MKVFTMLMGLPGSGKSIWAKNHIENNDGKIVYLSSDAIRKELYGDESIQGDPNEVFEIMRKRTFEALKEDCQVIYDATNVTRKNRRSIMNQIPKGVIKRCVVVWARIETCIFRDSQRERIVGEEVIEKMLKRFEPPYYDEGFDSIQIVNNDDLLYDYDKDFLLKLSIPHDNPHHPDLIIDHIKRVEEQVDKLQTDLNYDILKYMAKYHDVGKIYTKTFTNSRGERTDVAHYYSHQNVSSYITLGLISDPQLAILVAWLVNMHMEPFFNESKYYRNIDPKLRKYIEVFHELDVKGA